MCLNSKQVRKLVAGSGGVMQDYGTERNVLSSVRMMAHSRSLLVLQSIAWIVYLK